MKYYEDDDYLKIVQDLINTPEVQQLKNYIQHHDNDRYTHVIAVSYRSYVLAKHMGMDAISVARAGILHDLFYYDWRTSHYSMSTHAFVHPLVAVDAAKKITCIPWVVANGHHLKKLGYWTLLMIMKPLERVYMVWLCVLVHTLENQNYLNPRL